MKSGSLIVETLMNNLFQYKETLEEKLIILFGIIRIKFRKNKLSTKQIAQINQSFENKNPNNIYPKIKDRNTSLQKLINSECSIARFGDGEFYLILNQNILFQKSSETLSQRLKEILASTDNNIMIAIPNVFASLDEYTDSSAKFWRKFMAYKRETIYSLLDFNNQYYDSLLSRAYLDLNDKSKCKEYFENFKKIWDNKNIIFVEGEASRLGYKNDLFNNAKSIKRIICPVKNAFDKYSEIFEFCKTQPKNSLFILALGPTATVLAYDLAKEGFRALDLGHLDIEYEWFLQKATKKIAIQDKYVNEAKKGTKITQINSDNYNQEILVNYANVSEDK